MTTAEFARRSGATAGRLLYWRKRLRQSETVSDTRLLPVKVVARGTGRLVERDPGRVVLLDGRLRVEMEGMSAEWVATLMRLVRESNG
jgi:hypothetical protein